MSTKRTRKQKEPEPPAVKHGWTLYGHPLLLDQIDKLEAAARRERDPQGDATKVLKWITDDIFDTIPQNPSRGMYRQGDTLGKDRERNNLNAGKSNFFGYLAGACVEGIMGQTNQGWVAAIAPPARWVPPAGLHSPQADRGRRERLRNTGCRDERSRSRKRPRSAASRNSR
jgi:hypothetical protein